MRRLAISVNPPGLTQEQRDQYMSAPSTPASAASPGSQASTIQQSSGSFGSGQYHTVQRNPEGRELVTVTVNARQAVAATSIIRPEHVPLGVHVVMQAGDQLRRTIDHSREVLYDPESGTYISSPMLGMVSHGFFPRARDQLNEMYAPPPGESRAARNARRNTRREG